MSLIQWEVYLFDSDRYTYLTGEETHRLKDSRFLRDICQNVDFSCSLSMLFTPVVICNACIIALSYIKFFSNSLNFNEKGVILLQVCATQHRRAGRSTAVRGIFFDKDNKSTLAFLSPKNNFFYCPFSFYNILVVVLMLQT